MRIVPVDGTIQAQYNAWVHYEKGSTEERAGNAPIVVWGMDLWTGGDRLS